MRLTLRIWRQANAQAQGKLVEYRLDDVSEDQSFLEMLDLLNQNLIDRGEEPVTFDHDCREGICGTCGLVINGIAHGPKAAITTCQLHMRVFKDGDTITVEPWRSKAFPIIKDLMVDRGAFDRIIAGRRLHLRQHRRGGRRQRHSRAQGEGGSLDGCRRLHRVRRLRGGLPQLVGHALHVGQAGASQLAAAGPGRAPRPARSS